MDNIATRLAPGFIISEVDESFKRTGVSMGFPYYPTIIKEVGKIKLNITPAKSTLNDIEYQNTEPRVISLIGYFRDGDLPGSHNFTTKVALSFMRRWQRLPLALSEEVFESERTSEGTSITESGKSWLHKLPGGELTASVQSIIIPSGRFREIITIDELPRLLLPAPYSMPCHLESYNAQIMTVKQVGSKTIPTEAKISMVFKEIISTNTLKKREATTFTGSGSSARFFVPAK